MVLGKLHSPKAPQEEGKDKPLLGIFYLEDPENGLSMVRINLTAHGYVLLLTMMTKRENKGKTWAGSWRICMGNTEESAKESIQ